jgi:cell fate regulator YaaT (PSP1 superfamily)
VRKQHLVRVGVLGHVGRFAAADAAVYPRGTRVVCRTARGLEVGNVLSAVDGTTDGADTDGTLLRPVTDSDDLLLVRLERHRQRAYGACARLLAERGIPAVLMDVEHLFDGGSLYFYFLGDVPPEVEALTAELADAYEAKVQFRRFVERVTEGCGPGCGTPEAAAGACDSSCGTCAVAQACGSKEKANNGPRVPGA